MGRPVSAHTLSKRARMTVGLVLWYLLIRFRVEYRVFMVLLVGAIPCAIGLVDFAADRSSRILDCLIEIVEPLRDRVKDCDASIHLEYDMMVLACRKILVELGMVGVRD